MKGKDQVFEVIVSKLDLYIIDRVKALREEKGLSQDNLSVRIGLSEKFVGNVENPRLREKYNIRHLNLLAKVLDVNFIDLLPPKPFEDDLIKVKIKRTRQLNKEGKPSRRYVNEIVGMRTVKNRKE